MERTSTADIRQKIWAGLFFLLGLSTFVGSLGQAGNLRLRDFLLTTLLVGAIVLADHFPLQLSRGTRASLVYLPIFLSAVFLPVPLAVLAVGTGLFVGGFLARLERGLFLSDLLSTAGQWMFTAFLGYQILHMTLSGSPKNPPGASILLLCACAFLLADLFIFSLSRSFVFGQPFVPALHSAIGEDVLLELIQYLTAVLGILAAQQNTWSISLLILPLSITYVVFKKIQAIRREAPRILNDLAEAVDLRDDHTSGHSKRVAELVRQTLIRLNLSGPEAAFIAMTARLHDIGKIGIPESILMKPERLSCAEMDIIRMHSQKGAQLISKYKDFELGALMILHHHERWDGKGYPAGLRGSQIPLGARVIAVADSFDAMTSDRPYRNALSTKRALETLLEGRGKQWDARIVNAFVDMITEQLDEKPRRPNEEQVVPQEILQSSPISSP
jgi:HD-GYP domain-containing protein (c-di-GMP phosphodiesterase class II)